MAPHQVALWLSLMAVMRVILASWRGTGVNFWPAGQARGQVIVHSLGRRPGPGTRWSRSGAVTPSVHPEVPDVQFVSPGRGLCIRQSTGWRKVCGTAASGVLKGDPGGRRLPANHDHPSVQWWKRRTFDTAWVTPGHD